MPVTCRYREFMELVLEFMPSAKVFWVFFSPLRLDYLLDPHPIGNLLGFGARRWLQRSESLTCTGKYNSAGAHSTWSCQYILGSNTAGGPDSTHSVLEALSQPPGGQSKLMGEPVIHPSSLYLPAHLKLTVEYCPPLCR